jgi:hypothetical protein
MENNKFKSSYPMAKNKQLYEYFKRCLEDSEELYCSVCNLIKEAGDYMLMEEADRYKYLSLVNERNKLEGRIENFRYMMDIYDTRIQNYTPIFERECAEANANWTQVYDKARAIAEQNPLSIFGLLLKDHSDALGQEHKNELYKALKTQLAYYEANRKNGTVPA